MGAATVAALIAALLGGCIGFFLAWILVEYIRLVEGPPAAVLLVLSVMSLALFGGVLGFFFSFRWLHTQQNSPSHSGSNSTQP